MARLGLVVSLVLWGLGALVGRRGVGGLGVGRVRPVTPYAGLLALAGLRVRPVLPALAVLVVSPGRSAPWGLSVLRVRWVLSARSRTSRASSLSPARRLMFGLLLTVLVCTAIGALCGSPVIGLLVGLGLLGLALIAA